MTRWAQIRNNDPHSLIRSQIIDIPVRIGSWIADVPTFRQKQNRIAQIRLKCTIIDSPNDVACGIDRDGDIHVDCSFGIRGHDGIHWYSSREGIVETGGSVVYLGHGIDTRGRVVVCMFVVNSCESERLIGRLGTGARCNFRAHPDNVSGVAGGFDNDVCALTDLEAVSTRRLGVETVGARAYT